jgi:hypothetical protein
MSKFILAIVLLISSSWACAEGSISGWVRNAGGISPIHPVAVELVDPATGERVPGFRTVNKEDGTYAIAGIPEGNYKILFDAFGEVENFIDEVSGNRPCDDGGCDMTEIGNAVTVGSKAITINTNLTSGTIIAGRVTDSARRPLAGVVIETFDENGDEYCCTQLTDENGEWSKTVSWPNSYYVRTRSDRASGYQAEIWNNTPCDNCDPVATGSRIYMERKHARYVDFELEKIEISETRQSIEAQKISGSWFDPARDGEGFIVEVLDRTGPGGQGQEIVVFWFSYTPEGQQAWMVGTGVLVDGKAEVEFEITRGAHFGADFDPQQVSVESWGSVSFDFINCGRADADFSGTFGSGSLRLIRLTSINGLACEDSETPQSAGNAVYSGAWFNPARNGEGFILEVISERSVLVYWFTYDTDGTQMWLLGLDELDDEGKANIMMERSSGGRFGDDFDPAQITLEQWGELSLDLDACDLGAYAWTADAPYDSGGFELLRLTSLAGLECSHSAE